MENQIGQDITSSIKVDELVWKSLNREYREQLLKTAEAYPEFQISPKYGIGYWPLPEDWRTAIPAAIKFSKKNWMQMDISYEPNFGVTMSLYRKGVSFEELEKLSYDEKVDLSMSMTSQFSKYF